MEQAHLICGCLEAESFSLLLLDICLPVPVGASSEWERVGARPSAPAPQSVQARRHSWSGTAGAGGMLPLWSQLWGEAKRPRVKLVKKQHCCWLLTRCTQAVLVMSTKTKTPSIAQRRWTGGETPGESLTGAIVRTQSCPVFTILWELALKSEPPWWQGSRWTAGHLGRSTVTAVEALILPGTPLQWADTRFFYASHRGWSRRWSTPKTVPDWSPARVLLCLTLGRKSEPTAVGCWSKARQLLVIGVVYLHDS